MPKDEDRGSDGEKTNFCLSQCPHDFDLHSLLLFLLTGGGKLILRTLEGGIEGPPPLAYIQVRRNSQP